MGSADPAAETGGETILVVEDDHSIRTGLVFNLRAEGYRVLEAGDGPAGLELARQEPPPDLILLDLMLPGHSGLELLRRLRQDGLEMQVLILTALGLESDKVKGLRLGADDYITKPFGVAELLARIDAALRRSRLRRRARGGWEPLFGQVEHDRVGRRVRLRGEPVELTAREYDLLMVLCRHADRVYSREQLLAEVWGDDYLGTPRTVDNFICSLRGKLEPDAQKPKHLLTVRGVGYRIRR